MIYTLYCLQLIINTVDYNYIKDIKTMIVLLQEYLRLLSQSFLFTSTVILTIHSLFLFVCHGLMEKIID